MIEYSQDNNKNFVLEGFKIVLILLNYTYKLDPLHKEIQKVSIQLPDQTAIIYGSRKFSYRDLESKSNQIANKLLNLGIAKEETVGIYLNNSAIVPISILGVLKAGGAYVPISPDSPNQRVSQISTQAKIKFVITETGSDISAFAPHCKIIELNQKIDNLKGISKDYTHVEVKDTDTAYILFTSGSTGTPKGVVVGHDSLSRYMGWYLEDIQSITKTNLPQTSSICFAAAITQLYSPLLLGKTLHIIEADLIKNPKAILNWYEERDGFGIYCVPTLWDEVVNYVEKSEENNWKGPECVYFSGEALSKNLVDRTFQIWPNISLWNLYGPTEVTSNISGTQIKKGEDVHLGKAMYDAGMIVLNEELQEVQKGQEGNIYVFGGTLAKGYLNNPDLTEKTFISNHNLSDYKGKILYNTGDRGKFTTKGELIYLGRNDQQVKVRGYRIEVGEIELRLKEHPNIRQAACKVIEEEGKAIVAFIVTNSTLHANQIQDYLRELLPAYMVPEKIFFLDEMPKLTNGKINKHLLVNSKERPELSYSKIEGTRPEEIKMLSIWEKVLGFNNLGMEDDFFNLGGNSLKFIKLALNIRSSFNKVVEIEEIWDNASPRKLLALLADKPMIISKPKGTTPSIKERSSYPLTFNQGALWFIHQSRPDQTAYNMQVAIDFEEKTDRKQLDKALSEIVDRHNILRSNFKTENKNPVRVIHNRPINFKQFKTTTKELPTIYKQIETEALHRKYDLEQEDLIKFILIEDDNGNSRLYVEMHHIVFDGISINLFARELEKLLTGKKLNNLQSLFSDFEIDWKKRYYSGKLDKVYDFWKKKLEGANYFLNFPTDFVRPKIQQYKGANKCLTINASEKKKLEQFNTENKVTSFITLLSVFYILIHKYSREEDLLIGVPFSNRTKQETEELIGLFTNTIVYRSTINPTKTFGEIIDNIRCYTREALANQSFPFDKLVEKLNPERNISANPIFQVLFAYHSALNIKEPGNNLQLKISEIQNTNCKFDLDLEVQEELDNIKLNFIYNTSLFTSETIEIILQQYKDIFLQGISNKNIEVKDITLFPKSTTVPSNSAIGETIDVEDWLLHEHLEIWAGKSPEKIALIYKDQKLTYGELNNLSNKFANWLIENGASQSAPVAIVANRSLEMMIALFGILKSGAAYLPLDPDYPQERIKTIIKESHSKLLVDCCGKFCSLDTVTVLNACNTGAWLNKPDHKPEKQASSSELAYVIYTSGSTDTPKGVMVTHKSIVNRIDWMHKVYPIQENDTLLQKTAYTFDVSIWELFGWTKSGSRLSILAPDEEKNPETILQTILKDKVTAIHFVPSMLNTFLGYISNNANRINLNLKYIYASGEALENHHLEKFISLGLQKAGTRLLNLYGPTEASVEVTHFDTADAVKGQSIPIGKPIQNIGIHILDKQNNELPVNMPGELAISGIALAKGYLNRADLTKSKFIFHNKINRRLYKTGDLARICPNGNIEYMGRLDSQVKIRGYRIEMGEIENHLMKHPNVSEAKVVVKEFNFEDKRLSAYIVLKNKTEQIDFKIYLKTSLPSYMIPSAFVILDSMPVSSSGKLNKNALPDPFKKDEKVIGEKKFNNEIEKKLAKIWSQVLKTENFGLQDNFYDVGGYSLLLILMKSMIDLEFKTEISIMELFQHTSIRSLAEVLDSKRRKKKKLEISSRAEMQRKSILKTR